MGSAVFWPHSHGRRWWSLSSLRAAKSKSGSAAAESLNARQAFIFTAGVEANERKGKTHRTGRGVTDLTSISDLERRRDNPELLERLVLPGIRRPSLAGSTPDSNSDYLVLSEVDEIR